MSFLGTPREIIVSPNVAQQIRSLHRRAAQQGSGRKFLAAFGTVVIRLKANPDDFGEPTYRLPNLRLQIRCAVVPPLIIHFGIAEDRPVVYVKGVESLSE